MANRDRDILDANASFDLRLEAFAAALLETSGEYSIEEIVVAPQGGDRRQRGREVGEVRRRHYEHDEIIQIAVNRKGIFDTLPPGLFIETDPTVEDTSKKRTRAIRRQAKAARKFFLPFEQAIYHPRIETEQLEQRLTLNFPNFFLRLWGLERFAVHLDEHRLSLLCHLLPEAYRMVGNWELTRLCFEKVLRKPVSFRFVAPQRNTAAELTAPLENLYLGADSVLGGEFDDDMPALAVSIHEITMAEINDYLPGESRHHLINELLYGYFLPLELAVDTRIVVTDDAWTNAFGSGIIGYNLLLN